MLVEIDCMLLSNFFSPSGITDLLLLAALPSTSSEAISESLHFLISILTLAEKAPPEKGPDLSKALSQISALGDLSSTQLTNWLKRLVLGSSADGSSAMKNSITLLHKFIEPLAKPDW